MSATTSQHTALDLESLMIVSEAITMAAIERKAKAVALSYGAPPPKVEFSEHTPSLHNHAALTAAVRQGFVEANRARPMGPGMHLAMERKDGTTPSSASTGTSAGQAAPRLVDVADAAEQRHPVPAALAVPDRVIAGAIDRPFGEFLLRRLELLEDDDIRLRKLEPA